jgi:hypothetical protein
MEKARYGFKTAKGRLVHLKLHQVSSYLKGKNGHVTKKSHNHLSSNCFQKSPASKMGELPKSLFNKIA